MLTEKEKKQINREIQVIAQAFNPDDPKLLENAINNLLAKIYKVLLAKLQPEGMELKKEICKAIHLENGKCSKNFPHLCDKCGWAFGIVNNVYKALSPYLLQAKEEERERISFLLATWAKCPSGICPQKKEPKFTCTQCWMEALSSPVSTEKEKEDE